ncbi:MAG TPA: hypothetical protein VK445_04110 [Dissulfurispiraceae bacterium]|nr:hypothetical protein [Dissulfurispiraceae bacterium]
MKMLIDAIDSFIQEQTAVVCPWCTDVCCIDRHGAFDLHDLIYAFALDLPLPHYSHDHREIDPCRFLDASGCRLVRWQRPFRCTWHFCDALIKHMHNLPAKKVRGFNAAFQELLAARAEMLTAFEHIVQKRKQQHH